MGHCEDGDECRSPDGGELVQPRESFDLKLYYDEDRTYIVASAHGKNVRLPDRASGGWRRPVSGFALGSDAVSARYAEDPL